MKDLEICRKIAEIEGLYKSFVMTERAGCLFSNSEFGKLSYNPLTDDALCFRLMVKYGVNVDFTECPAGSGKAWYATGYNKSKDTICTDYVDSPNRAICLAIIKASECK